MIVCADCGKELKGWHEQAFHVCPQQLRANRRAQARQRERRDVLQVKCRCGAVATEYDAAADLMLCTACWDAEEQARADAARDGQELATELNKGPWPR